MTTFDIIVAAFLIVGSAIVTYREIRDAKEMDDPDMEM